jgi:putative DNA primase/helicase
MAEIPLAWFFPGSETMIPRARVHGADDEEKFVDRVNRLSDSRWADILDRAGVQVGSNPQKKTHCPLHEDKKPKFRFENKDGMGNWHCSNCGHGGGMKLLMMATGQTYVQAGRFIIDMFESNSGARAPALAPRSVPTPSQQPAEVNERRRAAYAKVWGEASAVVEGDPVFRYLRSRIPGLVQIPPVIRCHPGLGFYGIPPDGASYGRDYGLHPCMVAAVVDEAGRCCNIHRTYLTPDGKKLAIQEPDADDPSELVLLPAKKLMPSVGARHYQIRLAKPDAGLLGIAEGIETALAAMVYSGVPTWSVVATTGMVNFLVPDSIAKLVIFADNDNLTNKGVNPGLAAARQLIERADVAKRIEDETLSVVIRTPETSGTDMVNFLQELASPQHWQLAL